MLVIFFNIKELLIRYSFLWSERLTRLTTWRSARLKDQSHQKRQERVRNQDWSIHHDNALAHTAWSVLLFLTTKIWLWCPTLLTGLIWPLVVLSMFSRIQSRALRCHFKNVPKISWTIADAASNSKKSVSAVVRPVSEKIDPLHKLGMGLLWMEQQRHMKKTSVYFVMEPVRELIETPSYC